MEGSIAKSVALAIIVLLVEAASASAQRLPIETTPDPDELRSIFTFQIANDVFNPIGKSHRDYTNGVRICWLSPALPGLPQGLPNFLTLPTFFAQGAPSSVTRPF